MNRQLTLLMLVVLWSGSALAADNKDMHRLTLWLDCNSDFYGAYEKLGEQKEGKVIWPSLE